MKHGLFGLLAIVLVFFCGCAADKENPVAPIEVTISDDNQDQVWHAGPEQGLLGVTDFWFIPGTLHGSSIIMYNGPSKCGYEVSNTNNRSIVYFINGYIAPDDHELQAGTLIPVNEWVHIRMIIYNPSIPGWLISFLNTVNEIFFDDLEPGWVEAVFEVDIQLISGSPGVHSIPFELTTDQYKE